MKIKIKPWYIEIHTTRLFTFLKKLLIKKNPHFDPNGAAYYPFLFLRASDANPLTEEQEIHKDALINHEKIHLIQQLEMLIVFYWIMRLWYSVYYIAVKKFPSAYYEQPSEQEAYAHMYEPEYLKKRKLYSVFKYAWKKDTPVRKRIVTKNDNVTVVNNELVKGIPTFKVTFE